MTALLDVRGLRVSLGRGRARTEILHGIDLTVAPGEIVGLIGETGSGKTTLARAVLGLVPVAAGGVAIDGREVSGLRGRELRAFRRGGAVQYVFQDPLRSLDPDRTVAGTLVEGLAVRGGRTRAELRDVTREEALAHPTWDMGGKITIDSATLMNKGLELIEAHHLFGVPYDRIDVIVHPQSIVHSLIHLNDGASLAHLGYPDMRVPISYALHWPERVDVPVKQLDLAALGQLTFERPDEEAFPCLRLAREAAVAGGTAPCVLNAANEIAVHAFLAGELSFLGIPEVIERTLAELPPEPVSHFADLYRADAEARERARAIAAGVGAR